MMRDLESATPGTLHAHLPELLVQRIRRHCVDRTFAKIYWK
jgi:hypothetical protein